MPVSAPGTASAATQRPPPADQLAKGSTLLSTQGFIAQRFGGEALEEVLGRLRSAERERIAEVASTSEVPYALLLALWRAAESVLGAEHPDWIEQSGRFAIGSLGVELYGGILRKASPTEFLTQRVSLFRLYYQPGNMEVVQEETGRAVLRLVGFDAVERFFCRRQAAGLLCSVEIAGGRDARVEHCRCSLDGDAFCEWELTWR
jgi:hypothetical protein